MVGGQNLEGSLASWASLLDKFQARERLCLQKIGRWAPRNDSQGSPLTSTHTYQHTHPHTNIQATLNPLNMGDGAQISVRQSGVQVGC